MPVPNPFSSSKEATVYCPFRAPLRQPLEEGPGGGELERFEQQRGLTLVRAQLEAGAEADPQAWFCADGFQVGYLCEGLLRFRAAQGQADRWVAAGDCFAAWPERGGLQFAAVRNTTLIWLELRPELGWNLETSAPASQGFAAESFLHGPASRPARHLAEELARLSGTDPRERLRIAAKTLEWLSLAFDSKPFVGSEESSPLDRNLAEDAALDNAARYLEERLGDRHSIAQLSRVAHLNEFKLKQGFRRRFGNTVFGYLRQRRMERARELLTHHKVSVIEAATAVGYSNASHFARAFRETYGCNPKQLAALSGSAAPMPIAQSS